MRKLFTSTLFILPLLVISLKAQDPQLWLEGKVTVDTILLDGFEDMTLSPFTTEVDHPWTIDSSDASEGVYFAKATDPPFANQTSNLDLTITIPTIANRQATLLFDIKTDGIQEFFWIDDQIVQEMPYSPASWVTLEFDLPPGQYDLKWMHMGVGALPEFFYLDNVRIVTRTLGILRIEDGTEGAGKVLTSDAFGGASWQKIDGTSQIDTSDMSGLNVIFDPDTVGTNCSFNRTFNDGVGILVMNAPSRSYSSICTKVGYFSGNATVNSFRAFNSGDDAFYANNPGDDGFYANNAFDNGFQADNSGRYGFMSQNAFESGFYAENSGEFGFSSGGSAVAGFITIESEGYGMVSSSSDDHGFYSYEAGGDGFRSDDSEDDGFQASNSGDDGFQSLGSGGDGFYSVASGLDGIYSISNAGDEGYFSGTVTVTGNLSKGGGSFKIDHPLDPENKFLYHSFVESPDMMNVYNGNIILDENGEAVVGLPEYFEALNRDFRYQLTCVGGFAQVFIGEKIRNNQFRISGGYEGLEVSWQVTGIRKDPYANQNRIEVEVAKPTKFKGQYFHPEAYDQPFEKGFDYIKLGRKSL